MTIRTSHRVALAGVAAAIAGLVITVTPVSAQTTTTAAPAARPARRIDEARRRVCVGQIDRRLGALSARQQQLVTVKHLTDEHRAALNANIDQTRSGLEVLKQTIAAETSADNLRTECESIWTGYRVFALVLPRTRIVGVADNELFAAGRLDGVATTLQQAIDQASADGHDVTKAQADLDAMKAKTASGRAGAAGAAPSVLPLTPADWNANHDVLKPAHDAVKTGRDSLKEAARLGRQVAADLKA
jgi:hypothetical protein